MENMFGRMTPEAITEKVTGHTSALELMSVVPVRGAEEFKDKLS